MRFGEARVDDDGDRGRVELGDERAHRFIELLQARKRSALCGEVRSVDDDVVVGHPGIKSTRVAARALGCCAESAAIAHRRTDPT